MSSRGSGRASVYSYYHPSDFVAAVHRAYEMEQSTAAKDALAQILINSRLCAMGKRPICQDTGIVTIFVEIGMNVRWETSAPLEALINEGVRQAYLHPDNTLRASILEDPAGARKNTRDNTPAVIHTRMVAGDTVDFKVAAKGGGSENKSKLVMLNPSDSIVDWVVKTVPTMGAGWCPPGMLGIGIGGTAEKAMVLAKESLMDPIDIHELRARGPNNRVEELRLEIMDAVNRLGIGAQGLGGLTTVLDVKINDYPTHAASLPVAMIPNCAATRHAHFTLTGDGAVRQTPPSLDLWPEVTWEPGESVRRVDLDTVTQADILTWQPGLFQNRIGELVHSSRRSRTCWTHNLVSHRVNRPDVIDKLSIEIDGQWLPISQHLRESFMRGIAACVHGAREQHSVTGLPGQDIGLCHSVEVDATNRLTGLPSYLGP